MILRALARRRPKEAGETAEALARAIESYRAAASGDSDPALSDLWEAWDALIQSMKSKETAAP
jgi:hypothetical protein